MGPRFGFARDRRRDAYERPQRKGGLPVLRPRDITIIEVSLVQWPAYRSAAVTSLSVRSATDQDRHERSVRTIAEISGWRAARKAKRSSSPR